MPVLLRPRMTLLLILRYWGDDMILQTIISTTGGGGASLDVITAASLPATVVENQIVVITDTTPSNIYVATNEPASPANGDIWVKVAKGEYGVRLSDKSPYCDLMLTQAAQYSGSLWLFLDGYVGIAGAWKQFSIGLPTIGTPLQNWTWRQIIVLANAGADCSKWFAIGDEKDLILTTGEVVPVVIGAFAHNATPSGVRAQIAFTTKNCLNTTYIMNDTSTSAGGWDGSKMRNTHMANILAAFPAELRAENGIKTVEVAASEGQKSSTIKISYDRLRIHSTTELGLTASFSAPNQGNVYPYYSAGNRVKKVGSVAARYWTRSSDLTNTVSFCDILTDGNVDVAGAAAAEGVALAFDI